MMHRAILLLASTAVIAAFQPLILQSQHSLPATHHSSTCKMNMIADRFSLKKVAVGLAAIPFAIFVSTQSADALTRQDVRELTYSQVKGTGLANRCPQVENADKSQEIIIDRSGKYKIVDFCVEPKSFQLEQEVQMKNGDVKKEIVDAKLLTRATYSLSGMEGPLSIDRSGELTFNEMDGMDYNPITIQLPGGERVPLLFTVKQLEAKSVNSKGIAVGSEFSANFHVPSYRSGLFLDPRGRGGTSGYDFAVGLLAREADGASGQANIMKENNKIYQVSDGAMEFVVTKVDGESGEFSGVFVSEQLTDSDMGAKAPKKALLKGIISGRVVPSDGLEDY